MNSWSSLWDREWPLPTSAALQWKQKMAVSVRENERLGQYGGDGKTLCEGVDLRAGSCTGGQERTPLTRDCHAPRSAVTASGPRGDVEGLAGSPLLVSLWRRKWCQCKTPTGFRRPP